MLIEQYISYWLQQDVSFYIQSIYLDIDFDGDMSQETS